MSLLQLCQSWCSSLPEGTEAPWTVEHFEVSKAEAEFASLRAVISGSGRGSLPPGRYTRLLQGRSVIMSDTPDEIRDHFEPWFEARASEARYVAINGLGLGMIAAAILESCPHIERVVVFEKSAEVRRLTAPSLVRKYGDRIQVVAADAFEVKPKQYVPADADGGKFDVVWHDIWPAISAANLPEMTKLHRKWGRFTRWQGSWARGFCRRLA